MINYKANIACFVATTYLGDNWNLIVLNYNINLHVLTANIGLILYIITVITSNSTSTSSAPLLDMLLAQAPDTK